MKVAVLHQFGESLRLEERPQPRSPPEGAVLRVLGAGVCHTDLHISDGAISDIRLPIVLGHEISAYSEKFGPVLIYPCWGCGKCRHCLGGEEQLCPNGGAPGWTTDGGYAEYVTVPSQRYLMPLNGLDPIRAAPLADAGVTSYRAVRRSLTWIPRCGKVLVLGVGGLGQFAIQYLKLLAPTAAVVAVDIDAVKCDRALELGADTAVAPATVRDRSDVVLDFVGTNASLALAARAVERGGLVMQIGEGSGRVPFGIGAAAHEATFTTTIWASQEDLRAVLDLAQQGRIAWEVQEFPLADINVVLALLRQGKIGGRAVLRP